MPRTIYAETTNANDINQGCGMQLPVLEELATQQNGSKTKLAVSDNQCLSIFWKNLRSKVIMSAPYVAV